MYDENRTRETRVISTIFVLLALGFLVGLYICEIYDRQGGYLSALQCPIPLAIYGGICLLIVWAVARFS